MQTLLSLVSLIQTLVPQLLDLIGQAVTATTTGDQTTLDAIHARALAVANAMAPAGAGALA